MTGIVFLERKWKGLLYLYYHPNDCLTNHFVYADIHCYRSLTGYRHLGPDFPSGVIVVCKDKINNMTTASAKKGIMTISTGHRNSSFTATIKAE